MFLIDTCESGEVEDESMTDYLSFAGTRGVSARTIDDSRGLEINASKQSSAPRTYLFEKDRYIQNDLLRRSGSIVFSSCRGGELSFESDEIENGFFTESILYAIGEKKADADGNGVVTTTELRKFVINDVAVNTEYKQNPTVDRDNIYQTFGF